MVHGNAALHVLACKQASEAWGQLPSMPCLLCRWLKQHKHLRYMWIPYTDAVVVVQCNETSLSKPISPGWLATTYTPKQRLQPLVKLLQGAAGQTEADLAERTATQLRDDLIRIDPLNTEWIRKVNQAEAEHWRRSRGFRVGWSDEILGFDCGGQQWVLEVAFPTGGTINEPGTKVARPC
jgi:L-galactono-1,4-lactone dehydrogenase